MKKGYKKHELKGKYEHLQSLISRYKYSIQGLKWSGCWNGVHWEYATFYCGSETASCINDSIINEGLDLTLSDPNVIMINSEDVKVDGFVGGMGANSIACLTAHDLGFEDDVVGYVSVSDSKGYHYAEILDGDGYVALYVKSLHIDSLQKWLTNQIYKLVKTD